MKTVDLTIIGGGMVGLTLAASLEHTTLRIAIIEAFPPQTRVEQVTNRVSALNRSSEKLLTELGIWQDLLNLRATPYLRMDVWEKDSTANIQLDTQGLGVQQLGYIIENHLIQHGLWQKVSQQKNVQIYTALPQKFAANEQAAIISLADGELISSQLVVGADGANSWLRKQADIPLTFRDYGHHALVCNVQTAQPHEHCARQIFHSDSILAFLPLHQTNLCSIVWSLPKERADELVTCDEALFNQQLAVAFEHRLGDCYLQSDRKTVQLTARYARDFAKNRVALIGDAAHTIHPLAGLGVNLGFQDANCLAKQIKQNLQQSVDIGEYRHLRYFERQRKLEAVKMLTAMQGLKDLFNGDHPVKKWLRGMGLSLTNKSPILKQQFIKQALDL